MGRGCCVPVAGPSPAQGALGSCPADSKICTKNLEEVGGGGSSSPCDQTAEVLFVKDMQV